MRRDGDGRGGTRDPGPASLCARPEGFAGVCRDITPHRIVTAAQKAGKIPGARYVCLPGLGHMPNLESPAAYNGAIIDFLRAVL